MIICICSFTRAGKLLKEKIKESLPNEIFLDKEENEKLSNWVQWCFIHHLPVIFIGAAGIAVRTVAPFVDNKLTDSPVIVIDEKGQFVIPLLSGHVGGANTIAREVAEKINGTAVITTATDVENKFAVDVFAENNGLRIENKDGIKTISSKVLNNEKVKFWISSDIKVCNKSIPEQIKIISNEEKKCDVCIGSVKDKSKLPESLLYLWPKTFTLGIGCKKGKTFSELKEALESVVSKEMLENINSLSSISLKKNEIGLNMLAQFYHWPFITYDAEVLEKVILEQDDFSESQFVKEITGVSNVCERSAICTAGKDSSLIIKKTCLNGITVALAEQKNIYINNWSVK